MPGPVPRSPLAAGIDWASRIGALGLEFSLPALLGHFLDGKWGTRPWGLLGGMILGFTVGMIHLLRIARDSSGPS